MSIRPDAVHRKTLFKSKNDSLDSMSIFTGFSFLCLIARSNKAPHVNNGMNGPAHPRCIHSAHFRWKIWTKNRISAHWTKVNVLSNLSVLDNAEFVCDGLALEFTLIFIVEGAVGSVGANEDGRWTAGGIRLGTDRDTFRFFVFWPPGKPLRIVSDPSHSRCGTLSLLNVIEWMDL